MDDETNHLHARTPRPEDLVRICRSLNEHGARYFLIGGFAVIAHGLERPTKDIDLLVDDSPENISRVKEALGVLEDNAAAEMADDEVKKYSIVRVADEIVVDLLGRACGVTYADAERDAGMYELDGVRIPLVSPRTLIRTKQTGRPSDAADREFLEGVLSEREDR